MRTTIGVEEEFVLLDPVELSPVNRAHDAVDALRRGNGDEGTVLLEFFASQLEFASPVCTTAAEIRASLTRFRAELASWAANNGMIAGGVGAPYRADAHSPVANADRYRAIAAHFGGIIADHQINGVHVHVGVPDLDAAIRASNRLRPWLPTLLALAANSPFWHGEDTGFDSWRAIHTRRWTTHGIPPSFRDGADYRARTAALLRTSGITDPGTVNWVVRPSERYPTVEIRVFDAQLDSGTSAALASLVRGLVDAQEPGEPDAIAPELLDAGFWQAARFGLARDLLHPATGKPHPAAEVVSALLQEATPGMDAHGDTATAAEVVARIMTEGNGADRQRRALREGGTAGLARLIGATPHQGPPEVGVGAIP
ncbi:carboxylate-amine ligase [Diaminobutyricibacter sp. McL0618]|uniref:carboxylate-amine ligase n=1 Tax=Leifsonia sp. McL0618 TaxID=3415677 RepID=UPI003CEFE647